LYLQHLKRDSDMMFDDDEILHAPFYGTNLPARQCTAVTTQFAIMMEPPHMCEFEYRSDI